MDDGIIRRKNSKQRTCIALWLDDEYKRKYDILSDKEGPNIKMSEHLRRVVYPEIDRIWEIESGQTESEDQAS